MALTTTLLGSGGGGSLDVKEEGSTVVTAATAINFVAPNLTVTNAAGVATVTESTYTVFDPDKPPSSADARDDEFPGSSLDVKWGWINQGSATATVANSALRISYPSNGSVTPGERILQQAAPSTPFVIATSMAINGARDFHGGGLIIRDSGSGRIAVARCLVNGNRFTALATRMTNATTGSSDPLTVTAAPNIRLAMAHDGTTIHWYLSYDGAFWYEYYSETAAAFLAPTSTLQVGVMGDSIGTIAGTVDFDWFRCLTATSTPAFGGTRTITGS